MKEGVGAVVMPTRQRLYEWRSLEKAVSKLKEQGKTEEQAVHELDQLRGKDGVPKFIKSLPAKHLV